jgi:hypothetical protein
VRRLGIVALIAAALFILPACGVKTHPYPESVTLPGKVLDLKGELDSEGNLILTWKAPEENIAGRPLRSLLYFEVRSADYAREDFCSGCPSFFHKVAEVHAQPSLPGLLINPGPYRYQSTLRQGRVYRFQVAGFSERGAVHAEAWSEVTVYAIGSPGELSGFRASLDDRAVRLTFDRVGSDEEVEIERREGKDPFRQLPEVGASVTDLDVQYGHTYFYRGRKVLVRGEGRAPGPWSREISVSVEDTLPPRPVGYLDASLAEGGIVLKWESLGVEDDIKGYHVYRRIGEDGSFVRLGGLVEGTGYLDRDVRPGVDYRYQVTAVDNSPRANESLPSPEARVFSEPEEEPVEKPDLRDLGI